MMKFLVVENEDGYILASIHEKDEGPGTYEIRWNTRDNRVDPCASLEDAWVAVKSLADCMSGNFNWQRKDGSVR